MKQFLLASVAIIIALTTNTPVNAEPPGSDYYGGFPYAFLWCQSESDLRKLMDLSQKDLAASKVLFDTYRTEVIHGHSRCFHGEIGYVAVGENKFYSKIETPDGSYVNTWLVNVGNNSFGFWILWTEPVVEEDA